MSPARIHVGAVCKSDLPEGDYSCLILFLKSLTGKPEFIVVWLTGRRAGGQQLGDLSSNPAYGTCERGSLVSPYLKQEQDFD